MRPTTTDDPGAATLARFSRAQRWVHRALATLMLICIGTAAIMYNAPLATYVGHRRAVELIHVYAGFALPVPLLAGLISPAYRADLRRLNRFLPGDRHWLRSKTRRDGRIRVGKFNAGQKLNAALTAGSIIALLGSGLIMWFPDLTRLTWRTGSTLVHDWFALALGLLVVGHIVRAIKDPEARRGMRYGRVSRAWARAEHSGWADELAPSPAAPPAGPDHDPAPSD
jgi:formate dehydrogenase subunit gamma